jgi:hypothetical protein
MTLPKFIFPSLLQQVQVRQMINIPNGNSVPTNKLLFPQNPIINREDLRQLFT